MHGVSKPCAALTDAPGTIDEAGAKRLLRARVVEAVRQSLDGRDLAVITSGW